MATIRVQMTLSSKTTLEAFNAAKHAHPSKLTNDEFLNMLLLSHTLKNTITDSNDTLTDSTPLLSHTITDSNSNFVSLSEYNETLEAFTRMATDVHKLLEFMNSILELDLTTVKLKGIANSAKLNVIEDKLGI